MAVRPGGRAGGTRGTGRPRDVLGRNRSTRTARTGGHLLRCPQQLRQQLRQQLLLCPARHLWNDRRSSGAPAKRFLAPSRGRPKNGFPPKNGARVFALAFERCSKPCFGPSEGVGGALAPAGGPNVRGCQPLSAAPGVTPGAPSPAAAPKKGTRMHVRTRAASLQLYSTARVYWENSAPHRLPVVRQDLVL